MHAARRIEPLLVVPLVVAIALRLWGIDWGLPAVYEEAYPFKKAWEMWGFGPRAFDLNPHFFNYPTFFFYIQFLGQGFLYVVLAATGQVASALDFRVLYELDKTPFYLVGRGIAALFGVATVAAAFAVAQRVAGRWAGGIAALLVAVNQTHVTKSQAIEVDVPMTLLSTVCIALALRIAEHARRRDYILAGIAGGLAASTKYNGALLGLTIVVAHAVAVYRQGREARAAASATTRGRRDARAQAPVGPSPVEVVIAALVFAGTFLLTSPYVVLDRDAFWLGFNYERQHMRLGHFGLDDTPAFPWYMRVLAGSLLGWPLALAALGGLVWFAGVRRRGWAWVVAVFPLVYVALLSSFSMKAERYMIPVLPLAAVFGAAFVVEVASRLRQRHAALPAVAVVLATVALVVPSVQAAVRERARLRGDTRTLARQWIESHVPAGSLVVVEPYGPELVGVIDIEHLPKDVRDRVREVRPNMPVYAVLVMPMYQVRSENSAIFYDLSAYDRFADVIVTSSSIGSRYRRNPELYAPQVAFYDSLAMRWTKQREFGPADGSGPRIEIFTNPAQPVPFAHRPALPPPPPFRVAPDLLPGAFSAFFERLGFDYEGFGHYDAAVGAYALGLRYRDQPAEARRALYLGAIRNSWRAGRGEQALAFLGEAERTAPQDAALWRRVREQITARAAPDGAAVP